jgi:uncharacterized RDD family membrane protein YckC
MDALRRAFEGKLLARRLAARLIDWACVGALSASAIFLLRRLGLRALTVTRPAADGSRNPGPGVALIAAVYVLYTVVFEARHGRTPGKRLAGLRVAKLDGRRPSPGAVVLRNLMLSFPGWWLGLLVIPFDRRGRAFMDLIAGTSVVEG